MIETALALRAAGFVPVPLFAGRKHIDIARTGRRPFHLETRSKRTKELLFESLAVELAHNPPSDAEVAQWFAGGAPNIGIVGGHDRLIVLDLDRRPALDLIRRRHAAIIDAAPMATSPAGCHIYLRCRTPLPSSSLHAGLRRIGHVKGLGGYVVAPPSRLAAGGAYAWLPGRSPAERDLPEIAALDALGLAAVSPLKRAYDRARGRGSFRDL